MDVVQQLANVGKVQTQCSYFYRHAGVTQMYYTPPYPPPHVQLDDMGTNRNGGTIRALVVDMDFVCPPALAPFGVVTSTQHRQKTAQILFTDGSVATRRNDGGQFTVTVNNNVDLYNSLSSILSVLEYADGQY